MATATGSRRRRTASTRVAMLRTARPHTAQVPTSVTSRSSVAPEAELPITRPASNRNTTTARNSSTTPVPRSEALSTSTAVVARAPRTPPATSRSARRRSPGWTSASAAAATTAKTNGSMVDCLTANAAVARTPAAIAHGTVRSGRRSASRVHRIEAATKGAARISPFTRTVPSQGEAHHTAAAHAAHGAAGRPPATAAAAPMATTVRAAARQPSSRSVVRSPARSKIHIRSGGRSTQ